MNKGENGKANITMYSYTGLSSSTLFISGSGMENQRSAISRAGWSRKVFLSKIKAEGFLMFRTCHLCNLWRHFCLFYGVEKTNSIYCYDPTYNFDIIWNLLIRCWPQGLWGASSSLNKVQFALRSKYVTRMKPSLETGKLVQYCMRQFVECKPEQHLKHTHCGSRF